MHFLEKQINVTKMILAICVLPGTSATVHTHRPSHGLALILKDSGMIYTFSNGREIECHYGDLIYLPKNSSYTVTEKNMSPAYSKKQNVVYCMNFLINEETDAEPFKLKIGNVDDFIQSYDFAVSLWVAKSVGYEDMCRSVLYKIIAQLKRIYAQKYMSSKQRILLEPALQYMETHFHSRKIQIPQLAALCGISEAYFRKLFLAEFGSSAAVFLRNKRLVCARELLESGEYSVTDAALMSGFNDTSYFSREYKKIYGTCPSRITADV